MHNTLEKFALWRTFKAIYWIFAALLAMMPLASGSMSAQAQGFQLAAILFWEFVIYFILRAIIQYVVDPHGKK